MLELFFAKQSVALASHIALEEAGVEFAAKELSFGNSDQLSADYLAVNSKGRVPALVTPDGILTETPAILTYIAQSVPDASLAPLDDPFAFAKLQEFMAFMVSTLHVAHAHRFRGYRWVDASDEASLTAMKNKVPETMTAAFRYVEDEVFAGPYVMGASFSVADPYLFTCARWMAADGVNPAEFPKIAAHREMMEARPAVQKTLKSYAT